MGFEPTEETINPPDCFQDSCLNHLANLPMLHPTLPSLLGSGLHMVRIVRFELTTPPPQTVYSDQTELNPEENLSYFILT